MQVQTEEKDRDGERERDDVCECVSEPLSTLIASTRLDRIQSFLFLSLLQKVLLPSFASDDLVHVPVLKGSTAGFYMEMA